MNVTAMGKVGLTGWKGKLGSKVANSVSSRTSLSQDQVEALIGAVFLALAFYQFVKLARKILEAGRESEEP